MSSATLNTEITTNRCSLRDFVKVIPLPTKKRLSKSWFTIEDAIEALNDYEPLIAIYRISWIKIILRSARTDKLSNIGNLFFLIK